MFSTEPGSRFRLAASSAAIGFLAGALVVAIVGVAWERLHPPPPPPPDSDALPVVATDPIADLRTRKLEVPVLGSGREALRNTFADVRSGSGRHEAIDILAPKGTPVVAVEEARSPSCS